jgi:hypothetical protein
LYHAIISISILRQPLVVAAAATSQSVLWCMLVVVCVSRPRTIAAQINQLDAKTRYLKTNCSLELFSTVILGLGSNQSKYLPWLKTCKSMSVYSIELIQHAVACDF